MEEHTCEECTHYRRHYVKRDGRFWPLSYGHCVYPRLKRRECEATACDRFQMSPEYAEKSGGNSLTSGEKADTIS